MKKEQVELIHAQEIVSLIQETIAVWHAESEKRDPDYVIVTDQIRKIRPWSQHRKNMAQIVRELAATNTEIWHEEDKVRSLKDDVVLKAIRNINPLNQHRNDLMEEVDELMADYLESSVGRG